MNLRTASNRLIALYYRRWTFVAVVGIPAIVIQAGLQEEGSHLAWVFAWKVWSALAIVALAVGLAWVVSGLFEKAEGDRQ
ncbi:MAG: hypothetical protein ABUS57_06950 [Pseudomonadota bacterium]